MKKLDTSDPQFAEQLAQAAQRLEGVLEEDPALKPWGFFAIAAHGPFEGYSPSPSDAASQDAVWQAVEAWEKLGADYDLTAGPNQQAQIRQYAEAIAKVTTDPFFCIEPTITYPVAHVDIVKQLQDRLAAADANTVVRKQGSSIKITRKGEPNFVNPEIASTTYTTACEDSQGQSACTESLTILKKEHGVWKVNVMSNLIWIA